MILNLSESLAKPLVMAELNIAYLSISKNQRYDDFVLIRITRQAACHGKTEHGIFVNFKKTSVMMISNLSESLAKPLVMAELNMAYLSILKNSVMMISF